MDLVRKARPGEEVKVTEDLAKLIESPNESVVSIVETTKGMFKKMPLDFKAQGIVTYDTRNISTIPVRVGGRLEKLYVKYQFQKVSKGQKIAEIYSPELSTAQRELIYLIENDPENTEFIEAAKYKLSLLGSPASQINELIKSKEPSPTFSIYSPYSGYVIVSEQQSPTASFSASASLQQEGSGMDGMSESSSPSAVNLMPTNNQQSALPRKGSYVLRGETLLKIINTSAMRVELNIPSSQGALIKKGEKVQLVLGDGRMQNATIDFIQPFFNEGEEFIKVRVYTKRSEDLPIGHLVNATIKIEGSEGLWVPKEAVLDLGLEKIVFIKKENVFKPAKVNTGVRAGSFIEIIQGLLSSDEIASDAQFLVDSESFIKTDKQ